MSKAEPSTATDAEPSDQTVWVVAARREDSPHPSVEGVYDNEAAARDHRDDLANNSFQHGVVAWDVYERPVRSDAPGEVSGR